MFELAAVTRAGSVEVCFPDGASTPIADLGLPRRLSFFLERPVSVASAPPPGATFDEVWMRELKNDVDPMPGMSSRVEDGDEMIDNGRFMSTNANFFNFGALHIVTTSRSRRRAVPGVRQHPPQVDDLLYAYVLVLGRLKGVRLVADRHDEFAILRSGNRTYRLE